jgi:arylsulfatase A-like enzyme
MLTKSLSCVALVLTCVLHSNAAPPNIVFMFSDDHASAAISAYNDPRQLVKTPHIDRIAKEGIRFDRCVVPNSICGPVRAIILTGKYSHKNGFYNNNNSKFDPTQMTFPRLLQANGYQTAIIGKWHLVSEPVGFDHWQILPGQGVYYNPPMIRNGERIVKQGYVSDIIADESIDWLKKRDPNKPFLLMCQHKAPHREWSPALRHLGHNKGRVYPEPKTLFDDYANRGPAVKDQEMTIEKTFSQLDAKLVVPGSLNAEQKEEWKKHYDPLNAEYEKNKPTGKDLVRWRYQRYMHDYLGCVLGVDEAVGKVLNYLDENGLAENTIVVYSSDQGFYLGEHGWYDKRWIFEESLTTPLLVRWPGKIKAGSTNKQLVSCVDFAQTFLGAAGIQAPADMQGRSMLPILQGQEVKDWRTAFYYHYYEYPAPHRVQSHYGIVTDRYKLVHFYRPESNYWELYDREKDSDEMRDASKDPENGPVIEKLKAELKTLRQQLEVPEVDPPGADGGPIKRPMPGAQKAKQAA